MNRHFAIASDNNHIIRWQRAFPQGLLSSPAEFGGISHGDCAWVMVENGWRAHVMALVERGAVTVVMATNPTNTQALQAFAAGARGYIHLLSPASLLHQVETVVMNKGLWVGSDLLAQVAGAAFGALGGDTQRLADGRLKDLTEREWQVAITVANGRTNKEAARELDITERTVKAHLSAIFRKLQVRDRLQLIRLLAKSDSS